ncbi:FtsK/SpoIIIE domain-containing protein [Clostridium botulinum]
MTESTHEVILKYKIFNSKGELVKEFDESKQTKSQNKSNNSVLKDTYKKAFKKIFSTNETSEISNSKINKPNNDKTSKKNEQSNPQDNLFWKLSYKKEDNKSDKAIKHSTNHKETKENKNNKQNTSKNKIQEYNKKIKEDIKAAQKRTEFLNNWEKTMTYTGLFNKMHQTFSPNDLTFTEFGAEARLYIPWGYNYKHLTGVRETLQNNLQCTVVLTSYVNKNYIDAKFIYTEDCNRIKFKPVPAKPYELFLGVDESGNPILVDINSEPHVLVAGSTRSGKNGTLDHAITNLIYNCTEDEAILFLLQGAKGDLAKYRYCKQVKKFLYSDDNGEEIFDFIEYIDEEMNRRKKLFESMIDNFQDPNLKDYNEKHLENKLPYIYVFVDELMAIAATAIKNKKGICNFIIELLERIAQYGGAYGITYVISHQKPERQLLSTFLKNMSNVRVCYGFRDSVCSTIVLGEGRYEAVDLPPRKAYVICKAYEGYLYTLDLTDNIYKYVKKSIVKPPETNKKSDSDSNDKNDSNTKFNDQDKNSANKKDAINVGIKKLQEQNEKIKSLKTIDKPSENNTKVNVKKQSDSAKSPYIKNDFSKVHPKTKEELLKENLSKIEGYVPYIPPKPRE